MIKLVDLLLENQQAPKAIFLGGPAGAGKSTFIKEFLPSNYLILNVDDDIERELEKAGILDIPQGEYNRDQRSFSSKTMAQANKDKEKKLGDALSDKKNIIIDGTGAASNPIQKTKTIVENLGYETFMALVYASPLVSLERNLQRRRKLAAPRVLSSWQGVVLNIPTYRQMFGRNFVIKNNDPLDADKTYNEKEITRYLGMYKYPDPTPKTDKQVAQGKEKFEKQTKFIKHALQNPPKFNSSQEIQSKIDEFLS